MGKIQLEIKIKYELSEQEISQLKDIKKSKEENKTYLKDINDALENLENMSLVYRHIDNDYFKYYWFLTDLAEKLFIEYPQLN